MAYKKPQDPLTNNGFGIYPLTTADQVILSDGSRLEKAGKINADKLDDRTLAEIMLALYPVGSVYISAVSTSPASLFGGTWQQIQDRFLLGAGGNYDVLSYGGEAEHTLTVEEIASHAHYIIPTYSEVGNSTSTNGKLLVGGSSNDWMHYNMADTENTGGNQPHNNMPPYLAVYMWVRVS